MADIEVSGGVNTTAAGDGAGIGIGDECCCEKVHVGGLYGAFSRFSNSSGTVLSVDSSIELMHDTSNGSGD